MFVVPALAGIEVVCGTAFRLKAVLQTKIHSLGGSVSALEANSPGGAVDEKARGEVGVLDERLEVYFFQLFSDLAKTLVSLDLRNQPWQAQSVLR